MLVENFIRYNGKCYDVGTRMRFYNIPCGYQKQFGGRPAEGVVEKFIMGDAYIRLTDGSVNAMPTGSGLVNFDKIIIEIIEPVYYVELEKTKTNRNCPMPWEIEIGWIWYILIMLVGTIFKDRWLIYIVATAYFFLWKNGCLNGGKK